MKFTKMHGLGNDYIYINCFEESVPNPSQLAIALSDRHFGIGGDGLILICPSEVADVRMRMFNADGSESQMCGNGLRCVAKYTFDHNLAQAGTSFRVPGQLAFPYAYNIQTGNGILKVGLTADSDGKAELICVNMGSPILEAKEIPVDVAGRQVVEYPFEIEEFSGLMTCVSMGNPHAVFFCEDLDEIDLELIGPKIENHPLFPERINVHFVKVNSHDDFSMRTWERGSGITLACGTGACACLVAAVLNGKCERLAFAHLPGGDLQINWCEDDDCLYMTGGATEVFKGEIDI